MPSDSLEALRARLDQPREPAWLIYLQGFVGLAIIVGIFLLVLLKALGWPWMLFLIWGGSLLVLLGIAARVAQLIVRWRSKHHAAA